MELDCILDTCPKSRQMVNHINCCQCDLNPLGNRQPKFAHQECSHPGAIHEPDYERWDNMKACGAEVLAVTMRKANTPIEVVAYEPQSTTGMHWCPSVCCPNCGQQGQHQYQYDSKHWANYCMECEITWIYKGKEAHHDNT